MPERRRGGKKVKSKHLARASSQNANQNLKLIALALLFAGIVALCYQYLEYWTGPLKPSIDDHDEDHNIFTVVDIPDKGKGLIAARNIKQGELVIRERPLFVVPRNIQSSPSDLIAGKVKKLGRKQREAFLSLSYVNFPSHLDPRFHPEEVALVIFTTNAVAAGEEVGIFPRIARLNHGCSSAFNVVYTWRESEKVLVLFALRDIRKGDELLTTYTNTRKSRDERRAFLSKQYGFNCTCDVCSLPGPLSEASDERLLEISQRYEKFKTWGREMIDGVEAVEHIRKIWEIEEEEGYWSERGQLAADAAWIAASHSDAIATQAWARKAVEWFSYEIGMDASHVMDMLNIVEHPEHHSSWGTRDTVEVGGP